MEKNMTQNVEKMVNETLGTFYQEEIIHHAVVCSMEIHAERWNVLREIFLKIEELSNDELEKYIFTYGSLVEEDNLMARQIFQWLIDTLEEKRKNG